MDEHDSLFLSVSNEQKQGARRTPGTKPYPEGFGRYPLVEQGVIRPLILVAQKRLFTVYN
jgi:hypothetical protein